jgi:hypothetical protein
MSHYYENSSITEETNENILKEFTYDQLWKKVI